MAWCSFLDKENISMEVIMFSSIWNLVKNVLVKGKLYALKFYIGKDRRLMFGDITIRKASLNNINEWLIDIDSIIQRSNDDL